MNLITLAVAAAAVALTAAPGSRRRALSRRLWTEASSEHRLSRRSLPCRGDNYYGRNQAYYGRGNTYYGNSYSNAPSLQWHDGTIVGGSPVALIGRQVRTRQRRRLLPPRWSGRPARSSAARSVLWPAARSTRAASAAATDFSPSSRVTRGAGGAIRPASTPLPPLPQRRGSRSGTNPRRKKAGKLLDHCAAQLLGIHDRPAREYKRFHVMAIPMAASSTASGPRSSRSPGEGASPDRFPELTERSNRRPGPREMTIRILRSSGRAISLFMRQTGPLRPIFSLRAFAHHQDRDFYCARRQGRRLSVDDVAEVVEAEAAGGRPSLMPCLAGLSPFQARVVKPISPP